MRFEVGGTFVDASVDEGYICYESSNAFVEAHDLDETLVERSCVDVIVTISPSPNLVNLVSSNPLNIFHDFSSCSQSSLSLECCDLSLIDSHDVLEGNEVDYSKSTSTFRGYDPSLNPYSLYIEDHAWKNHINYCNRLFY